MRNFKRFRLMDDSLDAASAGGGVSTADVGATGGVGNGQATGTGQVADGFDTASAVNSISESLFGRSEEGNDNATKEPAPTPTPPAATETAPATTPAVAEAPAIVAPKTWKPEEAAVWATVPEVAKAAILRREEDIFRGIEQYKAPAEFGNKVNAVLQPYEQIMRAHNMDPVQTIGNLLQSHHTLATGSPAQRTAFMHDLARQYGVTLTAPAEADGYAPVVDPEVLRLQEELHAVQSRQQSLEQARTEEVRVKLASEVNAFAADPKNAHFDKVADLMVPMLKDKNVTLAQAYEKAIWLHPEVRELEIARLQTEKQAKLIADGKVAAENARKAQAANVKVGPKAGAATSPLGTMDDTMQEVMSRIKGQG